MSQDTMKRNRPKHTALFKAQVALEAMREQSTVAEIRRRYKINPNLVHKWKKEPVARLAPLAMSFVAHALLAC